MRSLSTTCLEPRRIGGGPGWRAGGFTLVSVIFILVVLAALGAALASMSMRQQMGSAA
jgi:MSHA biogenesis protein MshP